jgi:hypothetical protein
VHQSDYSKFKALYLSKETGYIPNHVKLNDFAESSTKKLSDKEVHVVYTPKSKGKC